MNISEALKWGVGEILLGQQNSTVIQQDPATLSSATKEADSRAKSMRGMTGEYKHALDDNSHLDAELLLAAALNKTRSYLRAYPERILTDDQQQLFSDFIKRRLAGEPVAYILGHKEFWSLDFAVTKDTLIPRPETELLVENVLDLFPADKKIKVADLGTGSGAIAVAIAYERPHWQVYAIDVSENALQIASNNAQKIGLKNISFHQGNWCTALPHSDMDIIVSNPPYIAETEWESYAKELEFEPRTALVSGKDGLDAIKQICQTAGSFLKANGYLLIEHGFKQACAVQQIFASYGYRNVVSVRDLAGIQRITKGQHQA